MLNVRRLTALTQLNLAGFPKLVGDAPVAALATSLPPSLAMLQLAGLKELEVGMTTVQRCVREATVTLSAVAMVLSVAPVVTLLCCDWPEYLIAFVAVKSCTFDIGADELRCCIGLRALAWWAVRRCAGAAVVAAAGALQREASAAARSAQDHQLRHRNPG